MLVAPMYDRILILLAFLSLLPYICPIPILHYVICLNYIIKIQIPPQYVF